MFRKLVSNVPFSPALVGQLGFYAKRLRKEELTRRLGLIFTVFAVIAQSFAVFSPPEQALATSGSEIIKGGVSSISQLLSVYDAGANGQNDYKGFMDYIGITRAEIANMNPKVVYVCSSDRSLISFGRLPRYSPAEGQLSHKVPLSGGGFSTFYSVPLYRFDSVNNRVNCYDAYVGQSAKIGWFAILRKCGNLQIKQNVQKFPKGHFVAASCKTVQGFAYDERQSELKTKVYLFFDGPPGKGKQFGPITADQATPAAPVGGSHGFSFAVPEAYQKSTQAVTVWAVMQPLPGWDQPTVQFDNTVTIPANCIPAPSPIAFCESLTYNIIDRTHFSFTGKARAEQGATITGYVLTVTDKSGKKVYEKLIVANTPDVISEALELKLPGDYTASIVVKTSIGDKEDPKCIKLLSVASPEKCQYATQLLATDPECRPCDYDKTIWIKHEDCVQRISQSKEAFNLTHSRANASATIAKPSDRIEFVIYTTNLSNAPVTVTLDENLNDILDYAQVFDNGGATFESTTKKLSWGNATIAANATDTRRFTIQVNDTIPATPRAANDPAVYDCIMTNSYGNTIDINVECPIDKAIEGAVKELPSTGPGENMLFAGVLVVVVTYFYARNKQLSKEVRMVRHEYSAGGV